jgi:hypothetical protein
VVELLYVILEWKVPPGSSGWTLLGLTEMPNHDFIPGRKRRAETQRGFESGECKVIPVRRKEAAVDHTVSDEEILRFLRSNWHSYPSQMTLMQKTVRALWADDPPGNAGERVVRLCLEESMQRGAARVDVQVPSQGTQPLQTGLGTMPL